MKRIILAILLSISMFAPAMAQQNIQDITIDCSNYINNNSTDKNIREACFPKDKLTPDAVREWGSLGKEFSTAVVETAKELGVAANEFLYTPVGIMIAFYFMWDMIGGIIIGIPLLIFIWWLYFKLGRYCSVNSISREYEYIPYLWGALKLKRKVKEDIRPNSEGIFAYIFLGIPTIVFSIVTIGTLIF